MRGIVHSQVFDGGATARVATVTAERGRLTVGAAHLGPLLGHLDADRRFVRHVAELFGRVRRTGPFAPQPGRPASHSHRAVSARARPSATRNRPADRPAGGGAARRRRRGDQDRARHQGRLVAQPAVHHRGRERAQAPPRRVDTITVLSWGAMCENAVGEGQRLRRGSGRGRWRGHRRDAGTRRCCSRCGTRRSGSCAPR